MLELWGTQSTPLLPLLPVSLSRGVVAPDRDFLIYGSNRTVWHLNCILNWIAPATMTKYSMSPSGERTFTLVFLWRTVNAATVFSRPYTRRICSIFPLCMESKALVKSTNNNVTCRIFARTPSRILRMVNICEVVDLFLRKPFWFWH